MKTGFYGLMFYKLIKRFALTIPSLRNFCIGETIKFMSLGEMGEISDSGFKVLKTKLKSKIGTDKIKTKNFFDYSDREKKKIIKIAMEKAAKMQQETLKDFTGLLKGKQIDFPQ